MGEGRGEGEGMKEDAPTSILPQSVGGRKKLIPPRLGGGEKN